MRLDDGAVVGGEVVGVVGIGGGLGPAASELVLEVDGGGEAGLEVVARGGGEAEERERESRRGGGGGEALLGGAAGGGVRGERLREPPGQGVEHLRRHLHFRRGLGDLGRLGFWVGKIGREGVDGEVGFLKISWGI